MRQKPVFESEYLDIKLGKGKGNMQSYPGTRQAHRENRESVWIGSTRSKSALDVSEEC